MKRIGMTIYIAHPYDSQICQGPVRSKKKIQPHIGGSLLAGVSLNPDGA